MVDKKFLNFRLFLHFLIFGFFLFLNLCQPIAMDDFWRAINDALVKHDLFSLLIYDFGHWTGRMTAQIPVYVLFSQKHINISFWVISIINAFAFYLAIIYSFKIVTRNKYDLFSKDFLIFCFFCAVLFFPTGALGMLLWKTAAIQYMWGYTLLIVLYYYLIILDRQFILFSVLVGFVIGLYNEQFVGVLLLLCFVYFLERKSNSKHINKGVIAFFVSCFICGLILVSAPGNYVRMTEYSAEYASNHHFGVIDQVRYLCYLFIHGDGANTISVILMYLLYLFLLNENPKLSFKSKIIYSLSLPATIFIMLPIVSSYGLQLRPMIIYYIIFFIATYQQLYDSNTVFLIELRQIFRRYSILLAILLFGLIIYMSIVYYSLYQFDKTRTELVIQYKKEGVKDIVLPVYKVRSKTVYDGFSCDHNNDNNRAFAKFYGFDSVITDNCSNTN